MKPKNIDSILLILLVLYLIFKNIISYIYEMKYKEEKYTKEGYIHVYHHLDSSEEEMISREISFHKWKEFKKRKENENKKKLTHYNTVIVYKKE